MTVTIKLDPALEAQLRRRAAASGRSTSEVIRAALKAYLAQPDGLPARSAYALGEDLFGRYAGPAELASERKRELADLWGSQHDARNP